MHLKLINYLMRLISINFVDNIFYIYDFENCHIVNVEYLK